MEKLYHGCRALFDTAFPGEDPAWCDALFDMALPDCLRVIEKEGAPLAMLLAIPYPIVMADGTREDARYLYAVATDPAARGQGLATRLLREVMAEGRPVFLRPMSPSLFDFYKKAGLFPVSPVQTLSGESDPTEMCELPRALSPRDYLAARAAWLKPPFAEPTEAFLSLGFRFGGALALDGRFAAYYERHGEEIYFKEWLGDTEFAPRVAAYLGAARYKLRTPCGENDPDAAPFAMAAGAPCALSMLIALD